MDPGDELIQQEGTMGEEPRCDMGEGCVSRRIDPALGDRVYVRTTFPYVDPESKTEEETYPFFYAGRVVRSFKVKEYLVHWGMAQGLTLEAAVTSVMDADPEEVGYLVMLEVPPSSLQLGFPMLRVKAYRRRQLCFGGADFEELDLGTPPGPDRK